MLWAGGLSIARARSLSPINDRTSLPWYDRRVVLFRGGNFNAPNLNSQISYLGLAAFLTMTQTYGVNNDVMLFCFDNFFLS